MPLSNTPAKREAQLRNLTPIRPSHGAYSQRTLEPYKQAAEAWVGQAYPWLTGPRRSVLISLAARCARVEEWCETRDIVRKTSGGSIAQPIVGSLHAWERQLNDMIVALDAEAGERERQDPAWRAPAPPLMEPLERLTDRDREWLDKQ
jgi:hypothetical protein